VPSVSRKQHNLMEMVAHDPAAAKRVGISQSVGKEFVAADKGKKFRAGGGAGINLPKTHHGKSALFSKGGEIMATKKMSGGGDTTMSNKSKERHGMTMEKMGKVKADGKRAFGEHTLQEKGHTRGKQVKMAGNTIGNGPLFNVKGPAMKKGGKVR